MKYSCFNSHHRDKLNYERRTAATSGSIKISHHLFPITRGNFFRRTGCVRKAAESHNCRFYILCSWWHFLEEKIMKVWDHVGSIQSRIQSIFLAGIIPSRSCKASSKPWAAPSPVLHIPTDMTWHLCFWVRCLKTTILPTLWDIGYIAIKAL